MGGPRPPPLDPTGLNEYIVKRTLLSLVHSKTDTEKKKTFKHNLEQHVLCDHVTSDSETLTQHLALMLTTSNKDEAGVSAAKSNWKKNATNVYQSVCFCSSSLNRKGYKKSKNKITSTVIKEQSLWTSLKKIQMLTSQLLSSGITPVVLSSCCKDSHRLVSEVWSHVAPADPLPIHWSHFCASSDLLTFDL